MNLIIQQSDSGLAQAWLMATVGSKSSYRRNFKKDINEMSISKTCDEVSCIAVEAQNLRITSNLLYGLSLIYKQKVSFMANDLSVVFDRITSPLFTRQLCDSSVKAKEGTTRGRVASFQDDVRFDIDFDFMGETFLFDDSNILLDEAFQRSLAIARQDLEISGDTGKVEVPAYIAADARDKSFLEYMNRANVTKETSLDESLTVDFEFNQDGHIVGRGNDKDDIEAADFLLDLNLDEDFNTVSATIEDISKVDAQTNADQVLATLDHNRAMVTAAQSAARIVKRRKLTPIVDDVTTINRHLVRGKRYVSGSSRSNSLRDIFYGMSMSQPPFLNMCHRMIYGTSYTSGMNATMFPSSSRHPHVTNLDSFLKEMDEIERGRDIPSRRPSSSIIDGSPFDIPLDDYLPEEFDIETLSPMLEDFAEEQSEETSGEYTHTLEYFKSFLHDRAAQIAETRHHSLEGAIFTLESLIPSKATPTEECTQRNLAAKAFSCLLQLVSSESIIIKTEPRSDYRASTPQEIYIVFN